MEGACDRFLSNTTLWCKWVISHQLIMATPTFKQTTASSWIEDDPGDPFRLQASTHSKEGSSKHRPAGLGKLRKVLDFSSHLSVSSGDTGLLLFKPFPRGETGTFVFVDLTLPFNF